MTGLPNHPSEVAFQKFYSNKLHDKDYRTGKNNRLCPCGKMAGRYIKVLQIEKSYGFWWGKGYPPK